MSVFFFISQVIGSCPGHYFFFELCGAESDFLIDGLGYLKILAPPEKILRWIEGKLNLLGRLPHYVSIDQKTYGRYGVLPTTNTPAMPGAGEGSAPNTFMGGGGQRLGP